ncbi:TonB-dependent receptor family protein [Luminiphilus syltensis]|nr:TonB-dependent receptor [Luminiphilus syltensis]
MSSLFTPAPLAVSLAAVLAAPVIADEASVGLLEEMTIIGSRDNVRDLAGTGALIDSQQLSIEVATDINQLLRTVPGLYIREEDGFGLRPNIGIRGATSERSAKVTLMEDGILMAPAPYAAPAAYYFPTTARMHSIEVLKGASLLRHGPQTTGGVVNMVSTPIPEQAGGRLRLSYGQDNQGDLLANYGMRMGNFSALVETTQRHSDGFKSIDRSGNDTGYRIEDYLVKLGWEGERQSLLVKAQHSIEESDETYLGLTDVDFAADEERRYGLSILDEMDTRHTGLSVNYQLALSEQATLTASVYRNEFSRDWFKLDNGGQWLEAANAGDATAQGILDGTVDVADVRVKHNNRSYVSEGVQANVDWVLNNHSLALGARVHRDDVDRFQPVEVYDQIDGELVYRDVVAPTGSNNRLEGADAEAFWLTDQWRVTDALRVDLALRYETIDSRQRRFADPERSTVSAQRSNSNSEWLPGISARYQWNDNLQLIAGVHRGFSPLGSGATESEDPETSINWEAGFRWDSDVFVEAVGFYSDFSDKAENCSNADPCSNGATSGSFTTGEAVISGLEVQAGTIFDWGSTTIPLTLMYTHTIAEADGDNPVSGVRDGDTLASIPENTLSLRTGIETTMGWDSYAVVKFSDNMCVDIGCNRSDSRFSETDSYLVVDLVSRYAIRDGLIGFAKIENVFDERAVVSRQPDGPRPNKPFTASVGAEWQF